MSHSVRRISLLLSIFISLLGVVPAFATQPWTKPTAAELSMKTDPQAPGASAVILNRYEIVDLRIHYHSVYERIKILKKSGIKYATVTVPWEQGEAGLPTVKGRTEEPNGKTVIYTGTPTVKTEWVADGYKEKEIQFTLPAVQVGSIVEYWWSFYYDHDWAELPTWKLQQPLYMHEAHYRFQQTSMNNSSTYYEVGLTAPGVPMSPFNWLWRNPTLPSNWKFVQNGARVDLETTAVPASPPIDAAPAGYEGQYWLQFYYPAGADQLQSMSSQNYWQVGGRNWLKTIDESAKPGPMKKVVAKITAGATTPMEKLQKIYAAVMTMDNIHASLKQPYVPDLPQRSLQLGRQTLSGTEAVGWRASELWKKHKATGHRIAGVFLAMVEAAGFQAEPMLVGDRERGPVDWGLPDWNQIPDEIVVVTVNGQKVFFDPSQPYCQFGQLTWNHYAVAGLAPSGSGKVGAVVVPPGDYRKNQYLRDANLTLAANGAVTGTIKVTMTGAAAFKWRQEAERYGEPEAAKHFGEVLDRTVPSGVTVTTEQFGALKDSTKSLTALAKVSGTIGALKPGGTIPSEFLMAREKQMFLPKTRTEIVDLRWPYTARDQVTLTLPAGYTVTGLPKNGAITFPGHADAIASYSVQGNVYHATRLVAMGQTLYAKAGYPQLRTFYRAMQKRDAATVTLEK